MAPPDSSIYDWDTVTTMAANDEMPFYSVAETDPLTTSKNITKADFFGATTAVPCDIALERTGANSIISVTRNSAASGYMNATTTHVNIGSVGSYNIGISPNAIRKLEITTAGIVVAANVYANDLNGGTIRTMVIDVNGNMGYDSSTSDAKTITGKLSYESSKWILNIPLITYTPKANPGFKRIGYTAESIEILSPGNNDNLVFYDTCQVVDGQNVPLSQDFENIVELRKIADIGIVKKAIAKNITKRSKYGVETEDIMIDITKKIQGVNHIEMIPYLISVIQQQEKRIVALEKK
jgi:hypothetical protein